MAEILKWFKRWLARYGFGLDRGSAGWREMDRLQSWENGDERRKEWTNSIVWRSGYQRGVEAERARQNRQPKLRSEYIDIVKQATFTGNGTYDSRALAGEGAYNYMEVDAYARGLRMLAKWGIVIIDVDVGRRVIARDKAKAKARGE